MKEIIALIRLSHAFSTKKISNQTDSLPLQPSGSWEGAGRGVSDMPPEFFFLERKEG
jgi:hypothetical protein